MEKKMGLDFYIAKSDKISTARNLLTSMDDFASLDDELQDYVYDNRGEAKFKLDSLFEIVPYADSMLELDNIIHLLILCEGILSSDFLINYDEINQAIYNFQQLEHICKRAIKENKKIIVIGD